jgi:hypothetical protein
MNKWTDIDELVQNIIAVAVVGVTLALEAASAFNAAVHVPALLEGASARFCWHTAITASRARAQSLPART